MRLGAYECALKSGSKAFDCYQKESITERHRHRYEFNNEYLCDFEKAGMVAAGVNPDTNLVEIVENTKHNWFVGVQFHPEYSSTVLNPHPLFVDFVKSVINYSESKK
ncbi:MAG: C26 family cysteine hydrolase domain-containing family [Bacteroidales bacterium]|nr:C26 family cysteine hydrolase domain-containing family [Bacteroidales bacterium]